MVSSCTIPRLFSNQVQGDIWITTPRCARLKLTSGCSLMTTIHQRDYPTTKLLQIIVMAICCSWQGRNSWSRFLAPQLPLWLCKPRKALVGWWLWGWWDVLTTVFMGIWLLTCLQTLLKTASHEQTWLMEWFTISSFCPPPKHTILVSRLRNVYASTINLTWYSYR